MNIAFKARPLRPEEQESFQGNLRSLMGDVDAAKNDNSRIKLLYCIFCTIVGAAGVASFVGLMPFLQKRVENHWIEIHDNGDIHEVAGAKDAAKLYAGNSRTNLHWAKVYIKLVENYTSDTDADHFATVQLLSSPDQRARYIKWHNENPLAPRQALGRKGSVDTTNYHFAPVSVRDDGHHLTEFHVTFTRTETVDGVSKPPEQREGDIQFQWWPEMVMNEEQIADNPGGMQTIYYEADKP